MEKKKALFLDRDGVVNKEKDYVHKVEDFIFIENIFETCLLFQSLGYEIFIVTNQAGIGRGYYTVEDLEVLNSWMCNEFDKRGVNLSGLYFCPHHPQHGLGDFLVDCECRKPQPGMILTAAEEHGIDLCRSIIVGDKESDIEAGRLAGVGKCILVRSGHKVSEDLTKADYVVDSLGDVEFFKDLASDLDGRRV